MTEFRPSLRASVPDGWFAKESVTLIADTGLANVICSSEPLGPHIDAAHYAARQGQLLAAEFPEFNEIEFDQAAVFGDRTGYRRKFTWQPPDGRAVLQIQLYTVVDSRGYTATATTPADQLDIVAILEETLSRLRIDAVEAAPIVQVSGDAGVLDGLTIGDSMLPMAGGGLALIHEGSSGLRDDLVVKVARPRVGGYRATWSPGWLHPIVGRARRATNGGNGPWVPHTLGAVEAEAALTAEGEILERDGGVLFPVLHGRGVISTRHGGRPFLVMEHVRGRRPNTVAECIAVLSAISERVDAGALDYHGDVKPEHVFIGDDAMRMIDPGPRFQDDVATAFTPEYNPGGVPGPLADVVGVAVMMFELIVGEPPFPWNGYEPRSPSDAAPPRPVGQFLESDGAVARFVDTMMMAIWTGDYPPWAHSHGAALAQLE